MNLATNQLIAELTPKLLEQFHGRGLIDFRVFPDGDATLFVFVRFVCEEAHAVDVEILQALASDAGGAVERASAWGDTAWIEVRRPATSREEVRHNVVPFRPRRQSARSERSSLCS
jgi:hypothetical protein